MRKMDELITPHSALRGNVCLCGNSFEFQENYERGETVFFQNFYGLSLYITLNLFIVSGKSMVK